MNKILETERLILRTWTIADEAPFYLMNQDPHVIEFLKGPLSENEVKSFRIRMQKQFDDRGYTLYAVQPKDGSADFIGFVGLNYTDFPARFTPAIEIGWRLAFEHWGKGYATEAARAVIHHAFTQLAITELVSLTTKVNNRSIRVMEKIGMTRNRSDDFIHPKLAPDNPLAPHLLYRLKRDDYASSSTFSSLQALCGDDLNG